MRSFLAVAILLTSAGVHAAEAVGYARATSQLRGDSKPELFQALNILDGKPSTVWCEGAEGDGTGESVAVGFRAETTIDEIRVTNGDQRGDKSFRKHNRVKRIEVRGAVSRISLSLADTPKPQSFKLANPVEAFRVQVELAGAYPGDGDDDATCLADVVFLHQGKPLNGPWLAPKLNYDRGRAELMNSWFSGAPRARDHFLVFFFDGTFSYEYRPFDPEIPPVTLVGEYEFDGPTVRFKLPGKEWIDSGAAPKQAGEETILDIKAEELRDTVGRRWTDKH